ncbi:MAG: T9SS type A sorting domain-containing protein [Bacteroidota bacterium]
MNYYCKVRRTSATNAPMVRIRSILLLLFIQLLMVNVTFASHLMGGQITFTNLGGNVYKIRQIIYRDCSGISLGSTTVVAISPTSAGASVTLSRISITDVSILCPGQTSVCAGGITAGIEEHIYEGNVTLPPLAGGASYTLSSSLNARNTIITTLTSPGSQDMYVQTILNPNLIPQNNSPQFLNRPIGTFCLGQLSSISPNGFDPDGDALVYSLIPARQASATNVNYAGGFSGTVPLSSSTPITINPTTGEVSFTPSAIQVAVICIKAEEYRGGVKIGEIIRDVQIKMVNCAGNILPVISALPNVVVQVGQTYCVNVAATDANNNNISLSAASGIIPPATFVIGSSGPGFKNGTFCFTPDPSHVGNTFSVSLTATDDFCPQPSSTVTTFNITVPAACNVSISASATSTTCAGTNGTALSSLSGGTAPYSYYWTGPGGYTANTDSINNLSPGTYCITIVDGNSCVDSTCVNVAATVLDDNNVCTIDSCDANGATHTLIDFDDNNICTTDACDPITGISHTYLNIDDNDVCTIDDCNPSTICFNGIQALDGSNRFFRYATVYDWDCCLFNNAAANNESPFAYPVDGHFKVEYDCAGHGIIIEATGGYATYPGLTVGSAYNTPFVSVVPGALTATHASLIVDGNCCNSDGSRIYVELTDERFGVVAGVTHTLIDFDDHNVCTIDACDPITGPYHTQVNLDDNDICTTDACDSINGITHIPVIVTVGPISGTTSACLPLVAGMYIYTVPAVPGATSYTWTTPDHMDIITGQGTNTLAVNLTSGSGKGVIGALCVKANTPCGSPTTCVQIDFSSIKPVTPGSISGPAKLCPGETGIYSVAPITRASQYNWVLPANMTYVSGAGTNVVTLLAGPLFSGGNLDVVAANACGSSNPRTRAIALNLPTTPGAISGIGAGVCGMSGFVYSIAAVPNATSYIWTVPGTVTLNSGQGTTSINVSFPSNFTSGQITVKSVNSCGVSAVKTFNVVGAPAQPGVITGPVSVCTGSLIHYAINTVLNTSNYTWTAPGVITTGQGTKEVDVQFGPSPTAGQVITVTASNACGTSPLRLLSGITVSFCIKAASLSAGDGLYIYPNPATDQVNMEIEALYNEKVNVAIIDITGRSVYSSEVELNSGINKISINTNHYNEGLYMVKVTRENKETISRLIINRD